MASSLQVTWQPWIENAVRLHCEGKGASEIGKLLDKPVPLICQVMEMPEFKAALLEYKANFDQVFVERLVELWDLSPLMVEVARKTAEQYLLKLSEDTPEIFLKDLRKDALTAMKDVLDRIGLKAPDKQEVKVTSRTETVDSTPLEVYEKRLQLIREHREMGVPIPDGLAKVELDG